MSASDLAETLILDGTKLPWHLDRVRAWEHGARIAPITIDMALVQACNASCSFCYMQLQKNKPSKITVQVMRDFLDDCAEIGVKSIILMSDGESTLSPAYVPSILYGSELGIEMANSTHGANFTKEMIDAVLPKLSYLRINLSGGEPKRYNEIMGWEDEGVFHRVCDNVKYIMEQKRKFGYSCVVGIQMVLMPQDSDQIMPFARLGIDLGTDYAIIKHCADDEHGSLGVDYSKYAELEDTLKQAERLSNNQTEIIIKWSKMRQGNIRPYKRCLGPPFFLQVSGTGLVAPCGFHFNDSPFHKKFHIGNITEQIFKDLWKSEHYWEIMKILGSDDYDAQTMCGTLCLQNAVNIYLDEYKDGKRTLDEPVGALPANVNFL